MNKKHIVAGAHEKILYAVLKEILFVFMKLTIEKNIKRKIN